MTYPHRLGSLWAICLPCLALEVVCLVLETFQFDDDDDAAYASDHDGTCVYSLDELCEQLSLIRIAFQKHGPIHCGATAERQKRTRRLNLHLAHRTAPMMIHWMVLLEWKMYLLCTGSLFVLRNFAHFSVFQVCPITCHDNSKVTASN